MGRLRVLSGREICRILARHGFSEVRRHGSHIVMQRRAQGTTQTVPVPNHVEVKIGTLLASTPDFEDNSQLVSAETIAADYVVTRNKKHFQPASLPT